MLALLLQSPLVHVSTLLVQEVLAEPAWAEKLGDADRRGLTALFWSNINPYGTFRLDIDKRLDLGLPGTVPRPAPLSRHRGGPLNLGVAGWRSARLYRTGQRSHRKEWGIRAMHAAMSVRSPMTGSLSRTSPRVRVSSFRCVGSSPRRLA